MPIFKNAKPSIIDEMNRNFSITITPHIIALIADMAFLACGSNRDEMW